LKNILQSTRGIIFLGTPHHGLGLARWAEMLAKSIGVIKQTNSQILQVLKDDSEVLARIQDSFHTMIRARNKDGLPPIEITCFYKELPLRGVGLVSQVVNLYGLHILTRVRSFHLNQLSYLATIQ
jgi:protein SERAC1